MSDYMVFPAEGWVTVDGVSCREMRVYQMDTRTATNELVGTYYLSSDAASIYQKSSDGQITLLTAASGG